MSEIMYRFEVNLTRRLGSINDLHIANILDYTQSEYISHHDILDQLVKLPINFEERLSHFIFIYHIPAVDALRSSSHRRTHHRLDHDSQTALITIFKDPMTFILPIEHYTVIAVHEDAALTTWIVVFQAGVEAMESGRCQTLSLYSTTSRRLTIRVVQQGRLVKTNIWLRYTMEFSIAERTGRFKRVTFILHLVCYLHSISCQMDRPPGTDTLKRAECT